MANNVLKDKDNNILNPKIPRYEKRGSTKLNNNSLTSVATFELNDNIENYDYLFVVAGAQSTYFKNSILIKVSDIVYNNVDNNNSYMISNYTTVGAFALNFCFPNKKQIKILDRNSDSFGLPNITEVYGINL